jgi:hypothetical protein
MGGYRESITTFKKQSHTLICVQGSYCKTHQNICSNFFIIDKSPII